MIARNFRTAAFAAAFACMLLATQSAPAQTAPAGGAAELPATAVETGNCLLRNKDVSIPILKLLDGSNWQTCMGVTLRPWSHHVTSCSERDAVKDGDQIHVRTGTGGGKELTYVSGGKTVLNRVAVVEGPNPFRPLWLRAQRDGYAYYVYMIERTTRTENLQKYYMLEIFDLGDKACLDELPENPGVVHDCPRGAREHRWRSFETGVGDGPETRTATNSPCEQLP